MKTDFTPGLELGKQFYWEIVRPVMDAHYPDVPHSAALIGTGSEIWGFDTALSTDHDWGPRVILFLNEVDDANLSGTLGPAIWQRLPDLFHGYPVEPVNKTKNSRSVEIFTIREFLLKYLGYDLRSELIPVDWLTFPEQTLGEITKGAIYWDGVNLQEIRNRFEYYPRDVWYYLLASGWKRIGQEEHLMGRAGIVGDEIGSALIAARLVHDLMQLCFLMEKQYAPYPKWFGTAFSRLEGAKELTPVFQKVLSSTSWEERQKVLAIAYEIVALKHNDLCITDPIDVKATYFYNRPFLVIHGEKFTQAISEQIRDPNVQQIAQTRLIGGIDQFSDNTDLLYDLNCRDVLKKLYSP